MSRLSRCLFVILLLLASVSRCSADLTPVSRSVTVAGTQPDTIATFSGFTSPNAFVTILDSNTVVGTTSADAAGVFTKSLTNQTAGNHAFGIQVIDSGGASTPVINLLINLQPHAETIVGDLAMPVTITAQTGVRPVLGGTGTPGSTLSIFIEPGGVIETAAVAPDGSWSHTLATQLPSGTVTAYVVASTPSGLVSAPSSTVSFDITCMIADYNCSGHIDMVDFSILMYYWGTADPTTDLNNDHIVDLTDFSILMFYWNE